MALSAALTQEIASSATDPNYYLFADFPQHPDDTLTYLLAGDIDKYELILQNTHAKSVIEKRVRNVILREYEVLAPDDASAREKKAVKLIQDILKGFDFDEFCRSMQQNSLLKGNGFGEIRWNSFSKFVEISNIIVRRNHRFKFRLLQPENKNKQIGTFRDHEIMLLTREDMFYGKNIPALRILCHGYDFKDDLPWGIGLGRVLYWFCVVFQKEIWKSRLINLDKQAEPTLLAQSKKEATLEQRQLFTSQLTTMRKGGVLTVPADWIISYLQAQIGTSSDAYKTALDDINLEISKCVLGETLSLELPGAAGSRAAAQTHSDESGVYLAKYDSDRMSTGVLKELCRCICALNGFDDIRIPGIWRKFPELEEREDLGGRSTRDSTLNQIGYRIKPEEVARVYGDGYEDVNAKQEAANSDAQQTSEPQMDVGFTE